jgi:hypothetical protein
MTYAGRRRIRSSRPCVFSRLRSLLALSLGMADGRSASGRDWRGRQATDRARQFLAAYGRFQSSLRRAPSANDGYALPTPSARIQPRREISTNRSKLMQRNESKIAFISFHKFFRIEPFQRITREKNKKIPLPSNSRLGLRSRHVKQSAAPFRRSAIAEHQHRSPSFWF